MSDLANVVITTDIGGSDPDDIQSLIHAFHLSNRVNIKAIICGQPRGKVSAARKVLNLYRKDYAKYGWAAKGMPDLRAKLLFKGVKTWKHDGPGPREIVRLARQVTDPTSRPLRVLVWGCATDLAAAIRIDPSIANKIVAYVIASWNRTEDMEAFAQLVKCTALRWVWCEESFRGIYLPGVGKSGPWSNKGFVKTKVSKAGALGKHFVSVSAKINVGAGGIKMGDTPSYLWAIEAPEGLDRPHWMSTRGGTFRLLAGVVGCLTDSNDPKDRIGGFNGARTVGIHRKGFLMEWWQQIRHLYNLKDQA